MSLCTILHEEKLNLLLYQHKSCALLPTPNSAGILQDLWDKINSDAKYKMSILSLPIQACIPLHVWKHLRAKSLKSIKLCSLNLPNKAQARLFFSMYSYTNNNWLPSMQHPWSFTRWGCCRAEIMPISFTNSRFPCFDFEESCYTAIMVPSDRRPCIKKISEVHVEYLVNRTKTTFSNFISRIEVVCSSFNLPQCKWTCF